ncbi:Sestrin-3 [Manis pentadactyla]|nr:Sestrin-3 [Manis pentadactyla]
MLGGEVCGKTLKTQKKEVIQADTADERTNFLVEEYSTSGRLDNVTQVMALHAQYLESFLQSQFYMLRMDGPLPVAHRPYIAINVRLACALPPPDIVLAPPT